MVTNKQFRELALSFPGTEENPHFDRLAFKVSKKRNFGTIHEPSQIANMRLPIVQQSVFCDYGDAINPIPNKWGLQGWTSFELKKLPKELILDALEIAYQEMLAPGK